MGQLADDADVQLADLGFAVRAADATAEDWALFPGVLRSVQCSAPGVTNTLCVLTVWSSSTSGGTYGQMMDADM